MRPQAGYIGFRRTPTSTAASGVWTLREAETFKRAGTWPSAGDPEWNNVVLLMHMEGSGASFTDSGPLAKTITASGNATQSETEKKFGSKSLYCDGTGDYISAPTISLSGAFTIEMFLRFKTSIPSRWNAIIVGTSANTQFFVSTKSDGTGLRWGLTGLFEHGTGSFSWAADTWYHMALTRNGSNAFKAYVDGADVTDGTPANSTAYSGDMRFGGDGTGVYDSDVYIDELRITAGVARTVVVPGSEYPEFSS